MVRRLLKGLAICAALYLGLKAWMQYQAYVWLEAVKAEYATLGGLQYDWMNVSPAFAEITLHGVKISPFTLRETIAADQVSLKVGDLSQLMMLGQTIRQQADFRWPDALSVSVSQLQIPVTDRWTSYWENPLPGLTPVLMPPCGPRSVFSADDIKAMGWKILAFEGGFHWNFVPAERTLDFHGEGSLLDLGRFTLALDLSSFEWPRGEAAEAPPAPRLERFDVNLEDQGGLSRIARFCADPVGVSAEQYPLRAFRHSQTQLEAIGIRLGEGVTAGLKAFFGGGKSLHVKVTPSEGFDLPTWLMQAPDKVADQLPVYFAVDDRVVIDPYYELQFERLMPALFPPPETVKVTPAAAPRKPLDTASKRKSYSEVEKDTLALYVGFPIKLTHRDGKITTGVLGEVSPYNVDIKVPMASGDVVFHVIPRDIKKVEIYQ
ncbi:MAG: hypothetical protein IPM37_11110 [Hahellaceae bacterium]|nr:hypothetical protein [Hahellaceae bacterium]